MSGIELVLEVIRRAGWERKLPEAEVVYDCSAEYWCGWILAYYQWYTGRSFKNIKQHISMKEVMKLYPTLHEAAEDKFIDTVNRMIQQYEQRAKDINKAAGTNLAALAQTLGCRIEDLLEQSVDEVSLTNNFPCII